MTERLYSTDSFLTNFDAVVTDIQEVSRASGQSLWRVALDRSAFYPTGGGQPYDVGTLIATSRSGAELTIEIVDVEEDEHGEVWHHTLKPLNAGIAVRGSIDAVRRLDHMQQHSGQHLLSAAFIEICGARTVSFHLGAASSTIDLDVDTLTVSTLDRVEERANQIIAEDRPVTMSVVPREHAESLLVAGELRKLPPRRGDLRIITIADFDRNACGGTHVRSTGQIGGLHLRGTEKVKQGLRVEFVCGLRAARTARNDFNRLTEAARQLSVGFEEVPQAVQRLLADAKQAAKHTLKLTNELTQYQAAELVVKMPVNDGLRMIQLVLTAANQVDVSYAKMLASKIVARAKQTATVIGWTPEDASAPATVVLSRSGDLEIDCGTILRTTLTNHGGRGGGSKDMAQGSVAVGKLQATLDELAAQCRTVIAAK
ncbi:MAG TPA: DHHA1 domain-containing protein [Acidobacteriaceae bacterium]|nr:DHHA1 domain-containing protein [Acidobacteriaceae bacterium]